MKSRHKRKPGLHSIVSATRNSLAGFAAAIRHEGSLQTELALCVVLAPLGLWLGESAIERILLVGSLLLVLTVELINSAIESVVDRVSLDDHPLAKRAKDIGSAAVMMSLVTAGLVWLLILFSP
jgi:diacylglycerol kinase (ATP)